MKVTGQIIELDPSKEYIMLVKRDSLLAKALHILGPGRLIKHGTILFTESFKAFKIIENSNRIVNIKEE